MRKRINKEKITVKLNIVADKSEKKTPEAFRKTEKNVAMRKSQ